MSAGNGSIDPQDTLPMYSQRQPCRDLSTLYQAQYFKLAKELHPGLPRILSTCPPGTRMLHVSL